MLLEAVRAERTLACGPASMLRLVCDKVGAQSKVPLGFNLHVSGVLG